jgi:hypothetical protein
MPSSPSEDFHRIVQRAVDGVATALRPAITGGTLGGELLALVVTVVDEAGSAAEVWHGDIADRPRAEWPEDSYAIARGKTALTVRTGLTAQDVHKARPDLLTADDVPWWGNTLLDLGGTGVGSVGQTIVVSASGLDEQWDQRICEAVGDLLVISLAAGGSGSAVG